MESTWAGLRPNLRGPPKRGCLYQRLILGQSAQPAHCLPRLYPRFQKLPKQSRPLPGLFQNEVTPKQVFSPPAPWHDDSSGVSQEGRETAETESMCVGFGISSLLSPSDCRLLESQSLSHLHQILRVSCLPYQIRNCQRVV